MLPLHQSRGFTLIEVVITLGIVAFAFVAIMGLLPVGLNNFRGSINTTVAAQIAQAEVNNAQQTDFTNLTTKTDFYDDQGKALSSSNGSVYWCQVQTNPSTLPGGSANTNLLTVIVTVAYNPGARSITNWTNMPGISFYTYVSQIARNQ